VLLAVVLSSTYSLSAAQIAAQDEDTSNEASVDKRVPHMMLMPYNYYPSYASASVPYESSSAEDDDRRWKRTPFYYPVSGRSPPRGMRFYKNNWFGKRDSSAQDGQEDESDQPMDRERRAVYFIPPSSSVYQDYYSRKSKRGIPYYYPVFPFNYRKRYWKRSDDSSEAEDSSIKREDSNLLLRDLMNGDLTDFGYDKKKRAVENSQ